MTIEEWIEQQEADTSVSIEEFYQGLVDALKILNERIQIAECDGVDVSYM